MRPFHIVAAGLLAFTMAARADTVYTYAGDPYDYVQNLGNPATPYSLGDSITGRIYFLQPSPLQPNQPVTTYGVTNFSFNDGVQTLDASNATIVFYFETDAQAAVSYFSIDVESTVDPGTAYMYVLYSRTHIQAVAEQANGNFAQTPSYGTLSAAPEPSGFLLLLTGVLGAAGMLRKRFV